MAEKYPLSEGSLRVIMRGGDVTDPIMQVLGSKPIASGGSDKGRYRILLSDGQNVISFAMLTTQANQETIPEDLTPNTIIKIKRYITSVINNTGKGNKRVLVILEMEALVHGNQTSKIGDPQPLPDNDLADAKTTTNGSSTTTTARNGVGSSAAKPTAGSSGMFRQNDSSLSLQDQLIHPISSLSPYQNKWVIKARVTNKSPIRKWSNSRGEGQLFSLDLLDESGEIRATAFREMVDKFYDTIEIDKVYYISKCTIKVANKQFSTLKNDYEMSFTSDTVVQECHDAESAIPQTHYDFLPMDKLMHIEVGTIVDIIGVCKETGDLQMFQAKSTGRDLKKRTIVLVDQSKSGIELTLWGDDAEKFDGSTQPIIAVKGAKVGEFGGGKNVSLNIGSVMKINPDIPQSHRLRGWFDNGGMQENVTNISAKTGMGGFQTPWINLKEVQIQSMGHAEKGDYFQTKATILLYRSENALYKACPTAECNKKIVDLENGMYRCEKCNREYPNFKYRLLGTMNIADWSGSTWVNLFATEAEKILGKSSQEIGEALERESGSMAELADKTNFKQFVLKCRAKVENYSDESRLKIVVLKVDPINYKEYNKHLLSRIEEFISQK